MTLTVGEPIPTAAPPAATVTVSATDATANSTTSAEATTSTAAYVLLQTIFFHTKLMQGLCDRQRRDESFNYWERRAAAKPKSGSDVLGKIATVAGIFGDGVGAFGGLQTLISGNAPATVTVAAPAATTAASKRDLVEALTYLAYVLQ